jgi:V8-like Glu-specific endopeptidase
MSERNLSVVLLLALALGGCSHTSDDADSSTADVVDGTTSGADQDMVVRLEIDRSEEQLKELCTGTLLAPNVVLTARHCIARHDRTKPLPECHAMVDGHPSDFSERPDFAYNGDVEPSSISLIVGSKLDPSTDGPPVIGGTASPQFGNAPVAAQAKQIVHEESNSMCGHDVAVLILDRKIPNAKIASVRISPPALGEKFTAVGWGKTDQAIFPNVRLTRAGIAVIALDNQVVEYTRHSGDLVKAITQAGEFAVGESTCYGDSGGPLLDDAGRVVGVTSRTPDNVSQRCVDTTVVYSHAGFRSAIINDALARAAAQP